MIPNKTWQDEGEEWLQRICNYHFTKWITQTVNGNRYRNRTERYNNLHPSVYGYELPAWITLGKQLLRASSKVLWDRLRSEHKQEDSRV